MADKDSGGLTPKETRFVEEYVKDYNGAKSIKRAGYGPYKDYDSAASAASRLLRNVKVQEAIAALKEERLKLINYNLDDFVGGLARIARHQPKDVFDMKNGVLTVKDFDDIPDEVAANIKNITQTTTEFGGSIRIEFYDKLKAKEMLARHFKWIEEDKNGDTGKSDGRGAASSKDSRRHVVERLLKRASGDSE